MTYRGERSGVRISQRHIFLVAAVIRKVTAREDNIRQRIEAVDMRDRVTQLRVGGNSALAELILSDDVQIRDLRNQHVSLSPDPARWRRTIAPPRRLATAVHCVKCGSGKALAVAP